MTNKPIIMIGNGGHAAVLTEILLQQNRKIMGFTAPDGGNNRFGLPYLGPDEFIYTIKANDIDLVLGIGTVDNSSKRSEMFTLFKQRGYTFASVFHESAIISPHAKLGEGLQILENVVIQPFADIADNTIINTSSIISHDCRIGSHCHIAPGAVLSGNVKIGNMTHIGTGSTIIQNVRIGKNVLIGAGSLVLKSISDNSKAFGSPAKEV